MTMAATAATAEATTGMGGSRMTKYEADANGGLPIRPPSSGVAEAVVGALESSQELLAALRRVLLAGASAPDRLALLEEASKRISDAVHVLRTGGCDGGRVVAERKRGKESAGKKKEESKRSRASTGAVRITSKTLDDGYAWRKYGKKDIQNAKNPRSYFRCTHKHGRGCQARRQVQASEEDPSTYHIAYMGQHTCMDDRHHHSHRQQQPGMIDFGSSVQPQDPLRPPPATASLGATTATQASDVVSDNGGDVTSSFHASVGSPEMDLLDDQLLASLFSLGEHPHPFLDM